jgi:hypothetical protein
MQQALHVPFFHLETDAVVLLFISCYSPDAFPVGLLGKSPQERISGAKFPVFFPDNGVCSVTREKYWLRAR